MTYTVQQLAELAGISVRTLHHYDEIGLLTPSRKENGYRSYGEDDLLTLQQILFFKELDMPLEEIGAILKQPDFDRVATLRAHRSEMEARRARLAKLITTIDRTVSKIAGEKEMNDDELFEAFWEKQETEYKQEAERRWGNTDAYKQSMERTKRLTKEDFKRMSKDADIFMKKLAALIDRDPASAEVQEMIHQHYESLRTFYDPSPEIYRGLAQMYVDDPRFRAYYEKYDVRMPEWMRDAMVAYCEKIQK